MKKKASITKSREPLGAFKHEIGRRDFLKSTFYGCAALGMGNLLSGCGGDSVDGFGNDIPVPLESRTYYFDLSTFDPEDQFHISMPHGNSRLMPMDDQARQSLADSCSLFAQVPESRITHYGQFEMPSNSLKLCYVYGIDKHLPLNYMALAFFHFPLSTIDAADASAAINADGEDAIPGYNKLRFLGVSPSQIHSAASRRFSQTDSDSVISSCPEPTIVCLMDHACLMTTMHLEALSLEPSSALKIHKYVENLPSTDLVAREIYKLMQSPDANPKKVLPDGSINLGWAIQYPIPASGKTGTQYRTYTANKSPRKGQIIYTVAWSQEEVLTSPLNETINATLQYVKENFYVNTTDNSQQESVPTGKLAQVRDGTPYVAPAAPAQLAVSDIFSGERSGFNYAFKDVSNETGMKLDLKKVEGNNLTFGISNWYVRYLGLGIQYLDSSGQPIKISALSSDTNTWADASLYKFLNNEDTIMTILASPESTIYGIPYESYEGELEVPYDPAASGIRVLAGGFGSHGKSYGKPTDLGMGFTIAFNLALPTIFLISDAAIDYAAASKAINEDEKLVADVAKFLIGELLDMIGGIIKGDIDFEDMGIEAAKFVFALASKPGFAALWGVISATLTAGTAADAAEEAIPIVGWILAAIEIAGLVATIAETIAEVIRSPFTYVSELTFTHDVTVTVHPSDCPAEGQTFPADLWGGAGGSYVIKLSFDKSSAHSSGSLLISSHSSTPTSDPISFTFKNVPYGGNVSVTIGMYTDDNFLAAGCATGYMPNLGGSATQDSSGTSSSGCSDPGPSPDTSNISDNKGDLSVILHVNEKKIPLNASTQYDFLQKTSLNADGNHIWDSTADAPGETAESLVSEPRPGYMEGIYDITVNEIYQSVGYSWRSSSDDLSSHAMVGLFANLSITDDPEASYLLGKQSDSEGFSGALPLYVSYDLMNKNNHNFFIDTSYGKNMVRQIQFSGASSPPSFSQSKSFGRFSLPSNAFVVHPKSIIYSVNREYNKIEKIDFGKYDNLPVDDADAPVAQSISGKGAREGLISGPVCMAVSADGAILVLEADNGRIQAFDSGLSPVKHFNGKYSFALNDGAQSQYQYVGMAIEFTGYIYVLSYETSTYAYRLDIYKPDGTFLTRTEGVNAGGIAVDFWRTVYTLNYEVLKKPDGHLPGVTEPSVSMWTPST